MKNETVQKILTQTKEGYNEIATSWDQTRQKPLIGGSDFLEYIKPGDKILDIGCGNGRIVKLFDNVNVNYTGIDNSQELIKIAKKNFPKYNFLTADCFNLPFDKDFLDVVLCLSVFHHFPSKKIRKEALREIKRVLKPNGVVIFYNWSWASPKMPTRLIKATFKKLFTASGLDFGDIYMGWGDTNVKRFVHLFTKRGMSNLLRANGFKVVKSYNSIATTRGYKNLVTIAKKC